MRRRKEAEMWRNLHARAEAPASAGQVATPKEGKPMGESTTVWAAGGGFVTTALTALSQMDWKVAIPVVLIGAAFAFWIIRERKLKADLFGV